MIKVQGMKPCPFCGESGVLFEYNGESLYPVGQEYQPGCEYGGHKFDYVGTRRECIDFWNQRKGEK